ncbi:Inactive angiotensin-converting enzyme- protein [Parelaphostrongylus tenuis]|uniref:Inactive angiotensin-converting enzyme- protein n=1 Tax=Parelaphostrongylus tenuis TaxID=148309 RepID=A0AAD5QH42_PARTN|nr:Inactive angiotensin-converting enzyme- protein [Parelaphostrongylus tenuis]
MRSVGYARLLNLLIHLWLKCTINTCTNKQPFLFREPASPSISDAIAKVFAHLSTNPHYLYSHKLIDASHLDIKDSLIIKQSFTKKL